MDKVQFSTDEIEQLRETIEHAKTYRVKKLKELTLLIFIAISLGIIASAWTGTFSWATLLITLSFLLIIMFVFSIAWYLAGLPIKRIEKDLEFGIKRTGISEINKINIFNRTIRLADGVIVYENEFSYGKWKKGDKIVYRTTISGEYLFEC